MTAVDTGRQDFHATRAEGLGGSDIAGILGLSSWSSPWSVWASKVGLTKPSEETERQLIGHELEEAIARLFSKRTGLSVAGEQMDVRHRRHKWARGFVDGFAFDGSGAQWDDLGETFDVDMALAGFEAKTDGRFGWPDGVPPNLQAQGQWYMLITRLPRWFYAVLHAGFRFEVYELEANRADQALIARRAARFWHQHCLTGEAPPIDGSDATARALAEVYPAEEPGKRAELDALADTVTRWHELSAAKRFVEKELKQVKNDLAAAMGEAEVGTVDGAPVLSHRQQTRAAHQVAESKFRVLRPATKKEIEAA